MELQSVRWRVTWSLSHVVQSANQDLMCMDLFSDLEFAVSRFITKGGNILDSAVRVSLCLFLVT